MTETVVGFPKEPAKPKCSECEHALFGPGGVYCRLYQDDIWNEATAEECDDFDAVPWAAVTVTAAKGD